MKTPDPVSVTATFVSAVLSLILPASAMAADAVVRHDAPAPDHAPVNAPAKEPPRADPFRHDPILESRWGPGDPNLAVPKFQFTLSASPARSLPERSR